MGVAGRTGQEAGVGFQKMEGSPLGPRAQEKQKLLGWTTCRLQRHGWQWGVLRTWLVHRRAEATGSSQWK